MSLSEINDRKSILNQDGLTYDRQNLSFANCLLDIFNINK